MHIIIILNNTHWTRGGECMVTIKRQDGMTVTLDIDRIDYIDRAGRQSHCTKVK